MEIKKIRELCKEAYEEGKTHQHFSNTPSIREAYAMHNREIPNSFEDTETFKKIEELYE